ncbi:MAG TPA: hypothetical protein VIU33_03590 [Nitrospiria bacterium]
MNNKVLISIAVLSIALGLSACSTHNNDMMKDEMGKENTMMNEDKGMAGENTMKKDEKMMDEKGAMKEDDMKKGM